MANVPTLLMVLFQMTGEQRWLAEPYLPTPVRGLSDNDTAGLEESLQDEIRHAAAEAILNWGRSGTLAVAHLSPDQLIEMLRVSVGEHVPDQYADMATHELQVGAGETSAAPPMVPPPGFDTVVIGAGASGLCAAFRLGEMGISYTVLERNDEVGGTWLENRYPGCGVDTPSHLYSFSFARHDWSRWFASRDELHGYFQQIADRFGIRPNIRFGIEVEGATWDDDTRRWTLDLIDQDGHRSTTTAAIVISAVGAFNKPKIPTITGTDSFTGPVVHTARWPEDLDIAGRRVGVIGNGASAMQLVPAIADAAESVTVFQRSPQWAAPFEKFKVDVPEPIRYLMAEVPLYRSWYRLRLTWIFNDRGHDGLQRDVQWPHQHRSINAMNDGHRRFLTRYLVKELDGRLEMLGDVLPTYPPSESECCSTTAGSPRWPATTSTCRRHRLPRSRISASSPRTASPIRSMFWCSQRVSMSSDSSLLCGSRGAAAAHSKRPGTVTTRVPISASRFRTSPTSFVCTVPTPSSDTVEVSSP